MTDTIRRTRHGHVLELQLTNGQLNLLTQEVRRELGSLFLELQGDRAVKCVLWTSGPKAFCAGADLKEFPARFDPVVARAHGLNAHRMIGALVNLDIPVIAAIDGACMGGGLELALACSIRIATTRAKLALPEIKRGVWPGTGGIVLLERAVGPSRAKRVLLTGEIMAARAAMSAGIVDEVVDDDLLESRAREFAHGVAAQPQSSIRATMRLIDRDFRTRFAGHLRYELEEFVQAYQQPAAREGHAAFFEKRAPNWDAETSGGIK